MPEPTFTTATVFEAEGARVGLVTCQECGATILLDPRDTEDARTTHAYWHAGVPKAERP